MPSLPPTIACSTNKPESVKINFQQKSRQQLVAQEQGKSTPTANGMPNVRQLQMNDRVPGAKAINNSKTENT
ncbi:hypothetical protein IFO70_07335 [Phormidium tenue FACHB-886]|nr:hypothetical protein [Phormidium tenue FACHB-886]